MKKLVILLFSVLAIPACTDDVKFNNPSFQGVKDEFDWRAIDSRVLIGTDGSMTIEAYNQFEKVTIKTSSTNPGTYTLGVNNINKATYTLTIDNTVDYYETSTGIGDGEIVINNTSNVNGTFSGTFKFNAVNESGEIVYFKKGIFYKVPITGAN